MGLSSVLRKLIKPKQEPTDLRDRDPACGTEYKSEEYKEPFGASTVNQSGNYDPNEENKPSRIVGGSHGGNFQPNQYIVTSSDHRTNHGGNYRPDPTGCNISLSQGQEPRHSPGSHHETHSRRTNRSRRRARHDTTTPRVIAIAHEDAVNHITANSQPFPAK